jgi:hypothetical protein
MFLHYYNLLRFFKNMMKNKSDFTYVITSLLDTLKLEKTVRSKALIETRIFDFTDPSSIN